ncbi:hypothetical protein A9B99_09240 [Mangrovibacter phragmitis]|uniref:Uncharacterized protein n=1 Tax=Mangrovibacter phragmitis TaxID=1691903 RepID=A0A1B7L266_9ENTR|nr:hypothetical protein A9B99_09240 [Mangrovibacter phragmitis]
MAKRTAGWCLLTGDNLTGEIATRIRGLNKLNCFSYWAFFKAILAQLCLPGNNQIIHYWAAD